MDYALIMAGGAGTRLWPLSREPLPKPALRLYSDMSMFQIAVERLAPLFTPDRVLVVAGAAHAAVLSAQVPEIPESNFILEPEGRGTAPAIALAAVHLYKRNPNARMAVLTADHHIGNTQIFRSVVAAGLAVAESDYLVTLGITPHFASTEYGYIKQAQFVCQQDGFDVYAAAQFVEKPGIDRAERMLAEGGYSWNSGMFIWKVSAILAEFERSMPAVYDRVMRIGISIDSSKYSEVLHAEWETIPKETIDYGVMEKARKVAVIPVNMEWQDVGNWNSLKSLTPADADKNHTRGDTLLLDCHDNFVVGGGRLVAAVGLDDIIIVDTPDALLVCHKDRVQEVRKVVAMLKEAGRTDLV